MKLFARLVFSFCTLAALLLNTACQTKYTKQFNQSPENYATRKGDERNLNDYTYAYGTRPDGSNGHMNRSLAYHNEMSLAVSDMPGVFTAVVMTTDSNAYAAVLIDDSGTGVAGSGNKLEGDHVGTTRGMYNWRTGRQDADPNEIATGTNSYFTVKDHRDLSDLFKKRVAAKIRKIDPKISEVHISANRDFINQMSVYREEARRGVDLNGYLSDFNALVKKQFRE